MWGKPFGTRLLFLVAGAIFAILLGGGAFAQSDPSSLNAILQSLGQQGSSSSSAQSQIPSQPSQSSQTFAPAQPSAYSSAPSRLELLYSQRAGQPLRQYGYDIFGSGQSVTATQVGGVQENYILGPGDQISVVNRGHDNSAYVTTVDRDGRLIIPTIEPVMAAGRSFGEVRNEIQARVARAALGTKSYVSLASARQISIVVSGEVNVPGVRTLSGLNSPIDALLLSGGVRKTGSLRNILIQHGGVRRRFDLYSFLNGSSASGVGSLAEGDRIIVPALQDTAAVIGMVKHPAIYELPPGTSSTGARALMRTAGGIEIAGVTRLTKIELTSAGRTQLVPLGLDGVIRSGEILSVDQRQTSLQGRVTLIGAVELPGTRSLTEAPTLSRLIHDGSDLRSDAYTLFGLILHRDARTKFRTASAFSLKKVFEGGADPKLADDDIVMVFSTSQIRAIAAQAAISEQSSGTVLDNAPTAVGQPYTASSSPLGSASPVASQQILAGVPGLATAGQPLTPQQSLLAQPTLGAQSAPTSSTQQQFAGSGGQSAAANSGPAGPSADPRMAAALSGSSSASSAILQAQGAGDSTFTGGLTTSTAFGDVTSSVSPDVIATQLGITSQALLKISAGYLVWVQGEVADPGPYLADSGSSLGSMLEAAGGTQRQADLSSVEVTSTEIDPQTGAARTNRNVYQGRDNFQLVSLRPLDSIRVRRVFTDRDSGTVTVLGQVKFPGVFNVNRGEHLSSLLLRAGGITNEGYPYGAVFLRKSAADAEAQSYQREATELQSSIGVAATDPNVGAQTLTYLQALVQTLRTQKPIGRITAVLDPVVLVVKPELDILLEPGDQIYIPKRPSTVAVTGEVLNAGAFQYRTSLTVDDYISQAGGETRVADTGSMFIIYPDGSAQPLRKNWISFNSSPSIPPGSTIVVPRDPTPFNTMVFVTNIADILSKLAITAASLAVLGRN